MSTKKIISIALVCLVIFPLIIHFFIIENSFPSNASNDGWLGFWGSYLGSTIGALITLYVLFCTLLQQNNHFQENKKLAIRPYFTMKTDINRDGATAKYMCDIKYAKDSTVDAISDEYRFWIVLRNIGVGNCVKWDFVMEGSEILGVRPSNIGFAEPHSDSPTNHYCLVEEEILIEIHIINCVDKTATDAKICLEFSDCIGTKYQQIFRLLLANSKYLIIDIGEPKEK